jgi:hypothetical protein
VADARIVIERTPNAEGKLDIDVKAEGFTSKDEVVVTLLCLVERLTGVSTDTYVALVDEVHKVAAREAGDR